MKQSASDEKIVSQLESIVKKAKGKLAPQDAAAETGYSINEVNDAFNRLLELYEARVNMNPETGKLQFIFKYPLERLGKRSFKEIMFAAGEFLWKIFQMIYKAAIGVIMVAYTVIFVIILIAIVFGGRGNNDRDDRGIDIGDIIGGLLRGIIDAFTFSYWMGAYDYHYDDYGYRYKRARRDENKGKNFVQSVFSFVFGPDRPKYDPLNDAKEAVAFIRQNGGKITAADIVALTGITYDQAETRLAEYAGKFRGELYVSNEGIVVGDFYDTLDRFSKNLEGGRIEYYKDEIEPPYELNGNTSSRNLVIMGLNGFNLVMSGIIISVFNSSPNTYEISNRAAEQMLQQTVANYHWLQYALGYFPLFFSISFFLIPLIRIFIIKRKQAKRELNVLRKKLVGAIMEAHGKRTNEGRLFNLAGIPGELRNRAKKMMQKIVIELRGEIDFDSDGEPIYHFERIEKELGYR